MSAPCAPQSPQVSRVRHLYKKSPSRSPLREALKSQCRERMKADRDRRLNSVRNIQEGGRSIVEATIRDMVRSEAASWRGSRKMLSFGLSADDVEEALRDLQEIEEELLAEAYGIDLKFENDPEILSKQVVCPTCQKSRLVELGLSSMVACPVPSCGLKVVVVGGLSSLASQLEGLVEAHGRLCPQTLQFGNGTDCIVAACNACDFFTSIGGF